MNKYYKLFLVITLSAISFNFTYAIPPTFNMEVRSVTRVPNAATGADSILQFDVYMLWTNSTTPGVDPFEYGSNQMDITFNPAIANGGTMAASRVTTLPPGGLPPILQTPTVQVILNPNGSGNMLFQGSSIVPNGGHNFIISDVFPGTCIGRYKIRTSSHTLAFVPLDFRFQLSGSNRTFPAYMRPPLDPKDPDNQTPQALMDTVANYYSIYEDFFFPPSANFFANPTTITAGGSVNFTDASFRGPIAWSWYFPGGTPSTSTLQNPAGIVYNTPGVYSVTIAVARSNYSSFLTRTNYIIVTNGVTMNLKLIYEGLYDLSANKLNQRDTVRAYVRQAAAPFSIVDSSRSVIDSVNFTGIFMFHNTPTGTYYIVPIHRNGLEVWSKSGGESLVAATPTSYDFTNALSKTFGNNSVLIGTKYCAYSGDVNKDGSINLADITAIFTDATLFNNGYLVTDLNGDNSVKLQDILIAYNNSSKFVAVIRP